MSKELHSGELYLPSDPEIVKEQTACLELLYDFNQTRPSEQKKRQALMQKMFGKIGDNCYIEPPFHANFGGKHCYFGDHIYANFGLTVVDDTYIYVGDHTMFGPHVTLATARHPILPRLRKQEYQHNQAIHIGKNCWLGSGVIVLPGVTIGDNTVVGAGSVVTKDLPANVICAGVPCKVLREINEHDEKYYFKGKQIPKDLL